MRANHFKLERLDVTTVTDREELAGAFGTVTAWEAAVRAIKVREAKATNPHKKRQLRLQLLNAENQLRLAKEQAQ
jgi:hypothetical protein